MVQETAIEFSCYLGLEKPIQSQVVQEFTKWKREEMN